MEKTDNFDIGHIAKLSHLELSPEEEEITKKNFSCVLNFIKAVTTAEIGEDIAVSFSDTLRNDKAADPVPASREDLLPTQNGDGFISVPRVVGQKDHTEKSERILSE